MRFLKPILTALTALALAGVGGGCYSVFPGQSIAYDYRSYVPPWASSVGTGAGSVSYIATEPGTVYLIDHNRYDQLRPDDKKHYAPHVIGSYVLEKGQGITVDGATQTITLGSIANVLPTVFKNPNLSANNYYEFRINTRWVDQ